MEEDTEDEEEVRKYKCPICCDLLVFQDELDDGTIKESLCICHVL